DSNNNALETVVSDKDGVIVFNDVIYGDYYIKETKAPDGYVSSSDIIKVSIMENGVVYYYEVENTRIKGTIEIKKVDNNGNVLEGAEFTLYDKDGKAIETAISDANGIARFEAVDYGIYTIKETKAPNGYKISDEEIKVEITSSEKKIFNVKNDKIKNESINESSNGSSNKNTNEDKLLPKTGSTFDVRILLLIGLLAII
ncbi:MSCRAMM family protein, partial [Clostridium perfringens]|uniref:MSCRAMM family protein n=1 Tax=Clostridium perfringens TaxID=1502 RepID=UPI002ACC2C56